MDEFNGYNFGTFLISLKLISFLLEKLEKIYGPSLTILFDVVAVTHFCVASLNSVPVGDLYGILTQTPVLELFRQKK